MTTPVQDRWKHSGDEPETPAGRMIEDLSNPPSRDELAYQLDRASIEQNLFGRSPGPLKIDRFTLLEHVGKGGMGDVYAAYDPNLDRKVAIKLVRTREATQPSGGERLLREARTLARLNHPNVVQVHDSGEYEGRVFLAMEYVEGKTLGPWLEENARSAGRIRDDVVLDTFVAVGRGLQAAHDKGLIHRDFKPQNVLIGHDGRPRVADFGLARPMMDGEMAELDTLPMVGPASQDGETRRDTPTRSNGSEPRLLKAAIALTTQGRILGTPEYMSPEQMRGEPADERSDQFSFCVALYEALCGERPFAGSTFAELRSAAETTSFATPAAATRLSAPIRAALMRGLSPDPDDRFGNMDDLLDALVKWPRQRRLRWIAAAAAIFLLGISGGGIYLYAQTPDVCGAATRAIDGQWTAERKAEIEQAFRDTGVPSAATTWASVRGQIDAYVDGWKKTAVASCEATHIEHTQSEAMLDRRTACLERARRLLAGVLDGFARADRRIVLGAPDAVKNLTDLAWCSDRDSLQSDTPPPERAVHDQVETIEKQLDGASSLRLLGDSEQALDRALVLESEAEATGYARVQAEVLFEIGMGLIRRGNARDVELGVRRLEEARRLAVKSRRDDLTATIWTELVGLSYSHDSNTERGRKWYEEASAAIQRIGDPPHRRAVVERVLARLDYRDGKFAPAARRLRQALSMLDRASGDQWLERALLLQDLGNSLRESYELDQANQYYEQARALLDQTVGRRHPKAIGVRYDVALLHLFRGQPKQAQSEMEQVLAAYREAWGGPHRLIGNAHVELAEILRQRGLLSRGLGQARAGLRVYRAVYPENHRDFYKAYNVLGAILYRRGDYAAALTAYEKALDIELANEKPTHFDVGYVQANIAEVKIALKRWDEGLTALEAAKRTDLAANLANNPGVAAFLLSVSGRAHLGLGERTAAVRDLEGSVRRFDKLAEGRNTMERADASWALARALDASKKPLRAIERAREALTIYRRQPAELVTPVKEIEQWLKKRGSTPDEQ